MSSLEPEVSMGIEQSPSPSPLDFSPTPQDDSGFSKFCEDLPTPSTERGHPLSPSDTDIELSILPALPPDDGDASRNEIALAPVDGGWRAWSFLLASAIVEALVWSLPFAYGIFLTAYLQEPKLASQPNASTLLPLIGTLSSGIIYCSGPVVYPFISYYPQLRRHFMWLGTLLYFLSLLISSYIINIQILVLLQGATYALGGSMVYAPCISYMSEWFVRRRGLANGLLFCGSATGGLVMPFILPPLLQAYGPFLTLRILAVAILILMIPCLFFIKPRLPEIRVHGPTRRADGSSRDMWLKNWTWWTLIIANTVQGFGYLVPQLWLPSASLSVIPLRMLRSVTSSIRGRTEFEPHGFFSVLGASEWLSSAGSIAGRSIIRPFYALAPGSDHGHPVRSMYRRLVGCCRQRRRSAGIQCNIRRRCRGLEHAAEDDPSVSMSLYGFLMLSRGLGNVLCSPVSTHLTSLTSTVSTTRNKKTGFDIEGGRFERLIVYVSLCYAGAALVAFVGWTGEKMIAKRQRL